MVLLLVLLVIGYVVIRNMRAMESPSSAGMDTSHPNTIVDKFKADVKVMEKNQEEEMPHVDPN